MTNNGGDYGDPLVRLREDAFMQKRRVGVVTGATHGLGRAISNHLADLGFDLVLIARSQDRLTDLAGSMAAAGHRALPISCDVGDAAQVAAARDEIVRHYEQVHVLVNNAGIPAPRTFEETDFEIGMQSSARISRGRSIDPRLVGCIGGQCRGVRHQHIGHQRQARRLEPSLRQREIWPDRSDQSHCCQRAESQHPEYSSLSWGNGHRLARRAGRGETRPRDHESGRGGALHRLSDRNAHRVRGERSSAEPDRGPVAVSLR